VEHGAKNIRKTVMRA